LVSDSILVQNPMFKGQCQKPLKVIQPPIGDPWKLSDCGNPPSMCHFMDEIVKPKLLKIFLMNLLVKKVNGLRPMS
ncbi:7426_t:CDS:1, partial [Funneliformis mosseae]